MTCALCKCDKPLLNSHVVPEFLYRPHYDDKHRTLLFHRRDTPSTMLQKGLRDRLLCRQCEEHLQRFEDYFARFWYQEQPLPNPLEGSEVILTDIDYCRFKLFVLSIAWRASVSKLPELTSTTLGPHEESMRRMIVETDPGPVEQYPVFAGVIVEQETKTPWDGAIVAPRKIRVNSHWALRMVFGGAVWTVLTSRHQTLVLDGYFLTEAGRVKLVLLPLEDFVVGSGLAKAVHSSLREGRR
jgi:hypothetical protein